MERERASTCGGKSRRVALFGGSFDPVHAGHLAIAQAAVEQADLDGVVFVPAAQSPLKARGPLASGELRLEMLRLALEGIRWALVSDWELQQSGPSYSWKTAEHFLSSGDLGTEWFWLMGEDQWAALERWDRWEYLASMVTFLVFGRGGLSPLRRHEVRAQFLSGQFPGSSTEIREILTSGGNPRGLVAPGVENLLQRSGIYSGSRESL